MKKNLFVRTFEGIDTLGDIMVAIFAVCVLGLGALAVVDHLVEVIHATVN